MSKAKKTGNFLVWAILLLLIVGLGGFGVTNFGGTVQRIGKVGDTPITVDEYARELQQQIRAAEQQIGSQIPLAQAQAMGIVDRARRRVVTSAALDNEVSRLGISVGDATVKEQVLSYSAFQGADGAFDRETYSYVLQQNGMSEAEFEEQIRTETARTMLEGAIVTGVQMPDVYGDVLYEFIAARRSYALVELTENDLQAAIGQPGKAEIETIYAENTERFTAPETKQITYAWMTPDMLLPTVEVDEAALRDLYQQRIDEYVTPERRLVERLVYPSREEAVAAKERLDAGDATFKDLVAERGLTLDDVDLGDVSREDLGAAADAVFAMEAPGVIGPVETEFGPALIRMNAVLAAQETTLKDVRDELKAELAADRARRLINQRMSAIKDKLAAGATLEQLAQETDMALGQIDYFDGQDQGIAGYEAFRAAAAEAALGDFPEIVELEDGGIFALRVDEVIPPRKKPLDAVRDEVVALWQQQETMRQLENQAQAIKTRLDSGTPLDALTEPVERVRAVTRSGVTPAGLSQTVFDLAEGETAVVTQNGSVFVVQVTAHLPPEAGNTTTARLRTTLQDQAAQGVAQDMFGYFAQAMLERAGMTLNENAINAVHAQIP